MITQADIQKVRRIPSPIDRDLSFIELAEQLLKERDEAHEQMKPLVEALENARIALMHADSTADDKVKGNESISWIAQEGIIFIDEAFATYRKSVLGEE